MNGDGEAAAPTTGTLDIEGGRRLFAQACTFVGSAPRMDVVPAAVLPEVAFAGRSNVGKSSLVNALTGRKTLARTSHTPGRTQELIFFSLGDRLMLTDLPGYGYARAPKTRIKSWTALVRAYLAGRPSLRRVCLLIDARHGLKDTDLEVMKVLDRAAVVYQVVLTKADKANAATREKIQAGVAAELGRHAAAHPEIIVTSAREGEGIAVLRAELAALVVGGW